MPGTAGHWGGRVGSFLRSSELGAHAPSLTISPRSGLGGAFPDSLLPVSDFGLDPCFIGGSAVVHVFRTIGNPWLLAAVGVVAGIMAPVLIGFAPLGGDPELMYQPIKSELGRALAEGRLPFWSDRFGLGVPLIAESHAAAFYPPNWVFYRLWDVGTAYRLTLWLHCVATRGGDVCLCAQPGDRAGRLGDGGGGLRPLRVPGGARRP